MDAIVIAGGTPLPGEPLYEETRGNHKALLDICGKPMVQWVLDALDGAASVERVFLIGLPEDSGVSGSKTVAFLPDYGGILNNVRNGVKKVLELNPQARQVLIVSADIPGIKSEMVDWLVKEIEGTDQDAYYTVITRQVMESRYSGSRRSYIRFKDVDVCGGDINVVGVKLAISQEKDDFWTRVIASRKNALKQAALIGYDTMLLVLFRLITMEQCVQMVVRRLNITGRAVVCPYAEAGMDVDKPFQLEIMRADLAKK